MLSEVREAQWSQLSELVAERMGLHFPQERWDDLQRGVAGAALELGFEDVAVCVGWLLSARPTKAQLQVLASHLTIGESYFFRDKQTLEALAEKILPELIRARRPRERRLRIWSAACSTGEEPYSLAILVHRAIPDLADWHVTILATDINTRFLQKAAVGSYGEWSFRATPAVLKERYFARIPDGRYAIVPEIKKLVAFAPLNLVEDVYPSLETDTNAMDLIFCRNVLMYFTPPQMSKVIGNLGHALIEGGWLVVSPCEASQALFSQLMTVNVPGAILYQKRNTRSRTEQRRTAVPLSEIAEDVAPAIGTTSPWVPPLQAAVPTESVPAAPPGDPALVEIPLTPAAVAELLYQQGRYAEVAETLVPSFAQQAPDQRTFSRSSTVAMICPMVWFCSERRTMLAAMASISLRMRSMPTPTSSVDFSPVWEFCAAFWALPETNLAFSLATCTVCRTSSTVVVVSLTAAADSLALEASWAVEATISLADEPKILTAAVMSAVSCRKFSTMDAKALPKTSLSDCGSTFTRRLPAAILLATPAMLFRESVIRVKACARMPISSSRLFIDTVTLRSPAAIRSAVAAISLSGLAMLRVMTKATRPRPIKAARVPMTTVRIAFLALACAAARKKSICPRRATPPRRGRVSRCAQS